MPDLVPVGVELRYATAGDVHIAYRVIGDVGPGGDLLWYPGAPMLPMESIDDEPSLARWQARLSSFCRVIEFDARGIGLSDPTSPSNPPTLEQWVEDAIAVLDAAGCSSVASNRPSPPARAADRRRPDRRP